MLYKFTCTTQSAPKGSGAPVLTLAHWPSVNGINGVSPAVITVRTLRMPAPSKLRQA